MTISAGEDQKEEPGVHEEDEDEEDPMDSFYPQTLAGFIMVVSEEGDMIYLNESVSKHIGITQVRRVTAGPRRRRRPSEWLRVCAQLELLGQSIYDFVHPCDQEELRDLLAPRPGPTRYCTAWFLTTGSQTS